MYRLYTWYRDGVENVQNHEKVTEKIMIIIGRNNLFSQYLKTNNVEFPSDDIPTTKLQQFSTLNPEFILVIVNTTNDEVTLFENDSMKKYNSTNDARIACGFKTEKVARISLKV